MPRGHFLMFPQKTLHVYEDTGLESRVFIFLTILQSILALLLRDSHSTAIHLYATGFIYTLQTFIKANLMGGEKVHKNSYENAAVARSGFCLNRKRTISE